MDINKVNLVVRYLQHGMDEAVSSGLEAIEDFDGIRISARFRDAKGVGADVMLDSKGNVTVNPQRQGGERK